MQFYVHSCHWFYEYTRIYLGNTVNQVVDNRNIRDNLSDGSQTSAYETYKNITKLTSY